MWNYQLLTLYLRLLPQGTVDNNIGRLTGPKALYPNYYRQPTLWLHDLCLEVLTAHSTELRLFWDKTFPLLPKLMSHIWHSCSRYNLYCLWLWRGLGWASNLLPSQRRADKLRVMPRTRVYRTIHIKSRQFIHTKKLFLDGKSKKKCYLCFYWYILSKNRKVTGQNINLDFYLQGKVLCTEYSEYVAILLHGRYHPCNLK